MKRNIALSTTLLIAVRGRRLNPSAICKPAVQGVRIDIPQPVGGKRNEGSGNTRRLELVS